MNAHQHHTTLHTDGHRGHCAPAAGSSDAYETEKDANVVGWDHARLASGGTTVKKKASLLSKVVLLVFVGGCTVAVATSGSGDSSTSGSDADASDLEYGAFDVCQQFVKEQLKAPSTAEFRNYFEDDGEVLVTGSGTGPYMVLSTVDSQNGFGAQIRSNFSCTVNHVGGETWRLADINVY